MRKIPTLFRRDPDDMSRVLPEVTPGCEWVLAGEGEATRKFDGTCCLLDEEGRWFARREVKAGKTPPPGFVEADHDLTTGKRQGWVPMEGSPFAKFHAEALANLFDRNPGTYELCGPKIQGNPEGFAGHVLVEHARADALYHVAFETFDGARRALLSLDAEGREGVVWHHPDGRMAKLKGRDFAAGGRPS